MRQCKTRPRASKDIEPVVRSTFDGRSLLPGEVPIIAVEEVRPATGDPLLAAMAMFDDMLSRPPPSEGPPIDRWGMIRDGDSGPVLLEAAVEEALHGDTTQPEGVAAFELAVDGWGDSGEIIEEWFRTGEFLEPDLADGDEPANWLGALVQRVRRAWSGPRRSASTAWDPA